MQGSIQKYNTYRGVKMYLQVNAVNNNPLKKPIITPHVLNLLEYIEKNVEVVWKNEWHTSSAQVPLQ